MFPLLVRCFPTKSSSGGTDTEHTEDCIATLSLSIIVIKRQAVQHIKFIQATYKTIQLILITRLYCIFARIAVNLTFLGGNERYDLQHSIDIKFVTKESKVAILHAI